MPTPTRYGATEHYQGDRGHQYIDEIFSFEDAAIAYVSGKFKHLVKPSDSVLDFGTGIGSALLGLSCARRVGVELNPAGREACEKRGLECRGDLSEVPDHAFDLVITNHCLEHVPYPIEALRQLREKIRPPGRLAICVPIDDWRTRRRYDPSDPNQHLHTWTVQLLGNTLSEAGFEVRPGDIAVVNRTRPGRFTGLFHRLLPGAIFELVCRIWAVPTRRRELFAVVAPRP